MSDDRTGRDDVRSGHLQVALELRWTRVTSCDNIPPREGRAVSLAGREIAVFNLGDRFLAVDNRCPHKAGPLADGLVTGASVVCPLHTWKISLIDGRVERPSSPDELGVATYPTRVEDGVVLIGVPAVAPWGDNPVNKIQDCRVDGLLLQERRLDPPCSDASGCVSSSERVHRA
jgi:nitrite reductase (NADH) small subunit